MGRLNSYQANRLLAGETTFDLGPYRIFDSIGYGGMGVVYKAEHLVMGRIVALGTPDELKAGVGGDVITIATADNTAAAAEIGHRFNLTPAVDNGTLRLEVSDGAAFVPRLVRELSMPVTAVTLRRPSLDDVFLKLTGRAIREEQAGALDQLRAMGARWAGRRH